MPKTNRSGQAATLTPEQLDAIAQAVSPVVRAALSTCRFTAARINEALSLRWENITSTDVVIPKAVTKKKMKTRTIPMNPQIVRGALSVEILVGNDLQAYSGQRGFCVSGPQGPDAPYHPAEH